MVFLSYGNLWKTIKQTPVVVFTMSDQKLDSDFLDIFSNNFWPAGFHNKNLFFKRSVWLWCYAFSSCPEISRTHGRVCRWDSTPRNADGDTVPLLRETMTLMPVSMKGTEKSMTSDLSSLMVREPTAMCAFFSTTCRAGENKWESHTNIFVKKKEVINGPLCMTEF